MFKKGDRIVVINNDLVSGVFNIGDKFIVESVIKPMNILKPEGKLSYYDIKHFSIDEVEYRKEKINKIKERICTKQ